MAHDSPAADQADVDFLLAEGSCSGCDLSGAFLDGVDALGADLAFTNFAGASLYRVSLPSADFTGADLTGADMKRSEFAGAIFDGALLSGADLIGANLVDAAMAGAVTDATTLTDTAGLWVNSSTVQSTSQAFTRSERITDDSADLKELEVRVVWNDSLRAGRQIVLASKKLREADE